MYKSYRETRHALNTGETTCKALVEHYLAAIESQKQLNAFVEVYAEEALERAVQIDAKLQNGHAGKLAGLVVGIKDVICQEDHIVQAGSKILDGFVSQYSATAVARLLQEDAIVIGRQNCDEFGMGSSNENSAFGPVKNVHDETRVPGGSSGASAVAVAAGMCLASLGTDTGGSVRQPAAFCGVVGLKPTYSRISRYGLIAYASSFDTIGVLANNAEDIAAILQIIAGKDDVDATVSAKPVPDYPSLLNQSTKFRIGYIQETIDSEGIDPEVKAATLGRIEALKAAGHQVEEVHFDLLDYVLPTYYILTTAEASTNLSRFDGARYGYRSPEAQDLETLYKKSRSEGFGAEVKRRIMLGTFVLSASYYDAYFTKAQKVRRLIKEKTEALLEEYDFLVMPTAPSTAFEIGQYDESDPVAMYLADLYTVQASVAGVPAISVPNGKDKAGLPIGFQIVANAFEEGKLLNFANSLVTA
ncbi:MAG: Asp-tRNA(Asn)/Glu-tRNA(Gln) amidotransferase subunit GatA [Flammeovirgaceae bacterium]